MSDSPTPTVVLVHGAFADASGWAGIIRELKAADITVVAPANPLRGISNDARAIRSVAAAIDGPVLLVGHSYGGAVITEAADGLTNLAGLVYIAAFAPAAGESVSSVQEPFPAPLLASTVRPTPFDAVGAVGGPDLVIDPGQFQETFAADLPEDIAEVMAVSQRPLAAAAAGEPLTHSGWAESPTWYLVSNEDRAISPDAQRFMAGRMNATVEDIDGSHVAFIAQPAAVAAFIVRALHA
ncbi:alpha/beta fold hydrolase [Microbacterium sp. PA5]|uniref:alpha/beta fold hydrolase n=1 Tax=Microbacterium sp. PA5 TaxID=3416654 RepID=UPI003CEF5F16